MGHGGPGVVCLGLLVLVLGLGRDFAASKSLTRVGRQIDGQNEEIGWSSSSSRRYPDGASLPVGSRALGYNHLYGRGLVGYNSRGLQTRQLKPPEKPPISVQCGEGRMLVTVTTDLYGDGRLVKASDLSLGPQSCSAGPQSTETMVVFNVGLQECGNSLQMTPDWLIYGTNLTVNPIPGNESVARVGSAVVPIQCSYPRYGNVSSDAVKPTWVPFASTASSEERLVFTLRLMTEDWSAPRPSLVFSLHDVFYIEASLETQNHTPMTLYIDRCVATASPDASAGPSYEIIDYYGCLIDGSQEDSSSAFRSPRPQRDALQFTVDAFQFVDSTASTIYITCTLRAAADTQKPDAMNKACSYNKASDSWSPVEGPAEICQCCNTKDCGGGGAPAGQSRRWGPSYRRPKEMGKRDVSTGPRSEDRWAMVAVGPLLVLGDDRRRSSVLEGSGAVKMWVLAGVGVLSVTVIVVFAVLTGRSVRRNRSLRAARK